MCVISINTTIGTLKRFEFELLENRAVKAKGNFVTRDQLLLLLTLK